MDSLSLRERRPSSANWLRREAEYLAPSLTQSNPEPRESQWGSYRRSFYPLQNVHKGLFELRRQCLRQRLPQAILVQQLECGLQDHQFEQPEDRGLIASL